MTLASGQCPASPSIWQRLKSMGFSNRSNRVLEIQQVETSNFDNEYKNSSVSKLGLPAHKD
jgi:hypothetical protein